MAYTPNGQRWTYCWMTCPSPHRLVTYSCMVWLILCGLPSCSAENDGNGAPEPAVMHPEIDGSEMTEIVADNDGGTESSATTVPNTHVRHVIPEFIGVKKTGNQDDESPHVLQLAESPNGSVTDRPLTIVDAKNIETDPNPRPVLLPQPRKLPILKKPKVGFTIHFEEWMNRFLIRCFSYYSCDLYCGESRTTPFNTFNSKVGCKCDRMCKYFGDCCQDYFEKCENLISQESVESFVKDRLTLPVPAPELPTLIEDEEYANAALAHYGTCQRFSYNILDEQISRSASVWMISKCPENFDPLPGFNSKHSCEFGPKNGIFSFPVSYRWNPTLVYKNIFCAFCHGVQLRDVLFWTLRIQCDALGNKDQWTLNDLIVLYESDSFCRQSAAVSLPGLALRSCPERQTARLPSPSPSSNGAHDSSASLDAHLCRSYFRPLSIGLTTYANIHCLACHDEGVANDTETALHTCPISHGFMMMRKMTDFKAELSFRNGVFSWYIHNRLNDTMLGPTESAWHNNNSSWEYDPMGYFFEKWEQSHSCEESKIPTKDLQGMDLKCSVNAHMFNGSYNTVEAAFWEFTMNITISTHDGDAVSNLHKLSSTISQSFNNVLSTSSDTDNPDGAVVIEELNLVRRGKDKSTVEIVLHWTSQEGLVTHLRQITQIVKDMRVGFVGMFGNDSQTIFVVKNHDSNKRICTSDVYEIKGIDLVAYGFVPLVIVPGHPCFLDLQQMAFKSSIDAGSDRSLPRKIDFVYLCRDMEFESRCGPMSASDKYRVIINNIAPGLKSTRSKSSTAESKPVIIVDSSRDDVGDYRNVCLSIGILGQIIKGFLLIVQLRKRNTESKGLSIFCIVARFVAGIVLILFFLLYIIAHEIDGLDKFAMGLCCHCLWLCLAGLVLTNAMWSSKNHNPAVCRRASEVIVLAVAIVTATCVVIDTDDEIAVDIGYSHKTNRIFWMTNEVVCSVGLIAVCGLFFMLSIGVQIASLFLCNKSEQDCLEDASKRNRNRNNRIFKTRFVSDTLLIVLFLIAVIDYFHHGTSLWVLLFHLVVCCLGLFDVLMAIVPRPAQSY